MLTLSKNCEITIFYEIDTVAAWYYIGKKVDQDFHEILKWMVKMHMHVSQFIINYEYPRTTMNIGISGGQNSKYLLSLKL